MTTRNFRVNTGLSVGDIVAVASTNAVTGVSSITLDNTTAPAADGTLSNKKYVDDSVASLSATAITSGTTNVTVASTTATTTISGAVAMTINATSTRIAGNLIVDGTSTELNTSTLTVEDNIIEVNRGISANSGMPTYSGMKINRGQTSTATENDLFWVWDESYADDGTTTYGNAGGAWTAFKSGGGTEMSAPTLVDIRGNVVHATSTTAMYADLAERYASDMALEAGDVVMLGGSEEVTKCNKELCDSVFGVVSDSPAFLMNAQAGNNDSHPMIALKGRVLVKLQGPGNAGDRIVSAGNGEAKVANLDECTTFNVLGRLLKDKYNEETILTECVIGVK
jgi:hypothetical protein